MGKSRKSLFACCAVLLSTASCGIKSSSQAQRADHPPPTVAVQAPETQTPPAPAPPLALHAVAAHHQQKAVSEPASREAEAALSPQERALRSHLRDIELDAFRQVPLVVDTETAVEEEAEPALIDEINDSAIPNDFSLAENREARLRATKSDLPLVLNSQVIQFVNYFSGRGRTTMLRSLERAAAYRPMIERILEEEGVPQELIYLAQAESGFRPKARSRVRATGMWQFMAFRGEQYGLRRDRHLDERYDAEKATRAAAQHLKDLYIEFGDWYLALAAYNSGPMRVKRAIEKAGGNRDYWTLIQRRLLPRETRNYVPIILGMTYVAKNLDVYGIEVDDPHPEIKYDTVETDSEIHFDLIADITGSSAATIKELNQALLRSATPPYSYALRLPFGSAEAFERDLALVPRDERLAWRRHRVRDGESLAAIAKQYGAPSARIAELNGLGGDGIEAGAWLTIPAAQRRVSYYGGSGGAGGFLAGGSGRYRIARGDNLGAIARRFGVSVAKLQQWNGLNGNRIIAGRYLIVNPAGRAGGSPASRASSGSGSYTIRRGDTLGAIAQRHGVSIAQLRAWNGLRGNRIVAGRRLVVGAKQSAPAVSAGTAATRTPNKAAAKYRVRAGDNLASIGQRFDVSVAELMAWNNLRSTRIQAGRYLVVSPQGAVAKEGSLIGVANAASEVPPPIDRYKIRRGDNLASIAKRYKVSVGELQRWNGLRGANITAGDYLTIRPDSASGAPPSPSRVSSSASSRAAASSATRYRIQRGDTLDSIARRFGVSVAQLRAWNGLRGSRIAAGRYLIVNGSQAASGGGSRQVAAAAATSRYQIRRGDSLEAIAQRFGVTVAQLKAWNSLRGSRIVAGDYLVVGSPERAQAGPGTSGS